MGLSDKADAYARTLSGGMRRRLLVAKALVHSPDVLILDEPTTLLDLRNKRRVTAALDALDQTIILATHDLDLIADYEASQEFRSLVNAPLNNRSHRIH